MKTTYNTGRVQIGLLYQPSTKRVFSRDELTIQNALLNQRTGGLFERIAAWVWRLA